MLLSPSAAGFAARALHSMVNASLMCIEIRRKKEHGGLDVARDLSIALLGLLRSSFLSRFLGTFIDSILY